ncbi:hypothetical protein DFH06DRAFT_155314 [Mycena polygramma]|nr:hypothetical protein DFH06DRAFT_155314 [Mycena polygramma]
MFFPRIPTANIMNYIRFGWLTEFSLAPDPVLVNPRGGGAAEYDVTGFNPTWILVVDIKDGQRKHYRQTKFEYTSHADYTALSYDFKSALLLLPEEERPAKAAPPNREYELRDRRKVAERLLDLYCTAERREGTPDRTEFVWLDEFCLHDLLLDEENDGTEISQQRADEVGRLRDIFGNASQVAVFCHEVNCDHTGLACPWGKRLFTFAEILHAQRVLQLTRVPQEASVNAQVITYTGHRFREAMQTNAARGKRWHLHAVYQRSVNAAAVTWQVAIHAMVVEAIRRDEASNFHDHQFLGKALNGLLPRRARLADLGSSGWNDLAWLLELNQGFYNAASLAAVCSLPADESVSWLGKPIDPVAGSERLEPVVTAFPVSGSFAEPRHKGEKVPPVTEPNPPLTIMGNKMIGLRPQPLKRDPHGLYNNEEMKGLRITAYTAVCGAIIRSYYLLYNFDPVGALRLYWFTSLLYCGLDLLVGTMYLDRTGWVFLDDAQWRSLGEPLLGNQEDHLRTLRETLGNQDNYLRTLTEWGDRQLIPKWEAPPNRHSFSGKLIDLRNRRYVEVIVVSRPNSMIPLAIHGSGLTCMLVDREDGEGTAPAFFAKKVGMCNLPTYAYAQTRSAGTVCITSDIPQ